MNKVDFTLATSKQIEIDLCKRIEDIRLSRNITQQMLAVEAGLSLGTIIRLEAGKGVSLDTFIRVLMALNLQSRLENFLPDQEVRPMERIERNTTERKRARPRKEEGTDTPWSWGDDEDGDN